MDPVATISYKSQNKKDLRALAIEEFKKFGYRVDRPNFGVIEIGEKQIERSLEYIYTDAEKAALLTVPRVLKRGRVIDGHLDHKGRAYGTVTIAAPVKINGVVGNVGVVVRRTGKNAYHTHRILMPNGSEFVFENTKNAEPTSLDMPAASGDQGPSISSASDYSIPDSSEKSNTNIPSRHNRKQKTPRVQPPREIVSEPMSEQGYADESARAATLGVDFTAVPPKDPRMTNSQYIEKTLADPTVPEVTKQYIREHENLYPVLTNAELNARAMEVLGSNAGFANGGTRLG